MTKDIKNQVIELLNTAVEGVDCAEKQEGNDSATEVLCDCYNAVRAVEYAVATGLTDQRMAYYIEMTEALKNMLEYINDMIVSGEEHFDVRGKFESLVTLMSKELEKESEVA